MWCEWGKENIPQYGPDYLGKAETNHKKRVYFIVDATYLPAVGNNRRSGQYPVLDDKMEN